MNWITSPDGFEPIKAVSKLGDIEEEVVFNNPLDGGDIRIFIKNDRMLPRDPLEFQISVIASPSKVSSVHLFQTWLKMSRWDENLVGDFQLVLTPP